MWNNNDMLSLDRHIGSLKYIIPTIQILSLMKEVEKWLSMNDCGAIIYGRSRVGKTRAITYISEELRNNFGAELPIYVYCATDYPATQKTFYSSLLTVMKHEDPHRGTAVQLRQRLVNRIIVNAIGTKYRRAVLFVDEAYLLTEKEYIWLIDIYNELYNNDILLTVFLVGTPELKEQKISFMRTGKEQIIQRFMTNEYEFHGIRNLKEMMACLDFMDEEIYIPNTGEKVILSKYFFPLAYEDGIRLIDYAGDIYSAFRELQMKYNVKSNEILMKHFVDAVLYCMKMYGIHGKAHYKPVKEEWTDAILNIGFIYNQLSGDKL